MRPHWDDVWLDVARVVARRSLCTRAQVGAVIVDQRYRVVATGYNGAPRGFDHRDEPCTEWCARSQGDVLEQSYANCPSLHAEANALMAADRSTWEGGIIYVTGHICADCAKLVGNSGLSRVVIQPDGIDREYRAPEDSYRFIRALGIGVEVLSMPHPDSLPTVYLEGKTIVMSSTAGWINVVPGDPLELDEIIETFRAQKLQDGLRTVGDQADGVK